MQFRARCREKIEKKKENLEADTCAVPCTLTYVFAHALQTAHDIWENWTAGASHAGDSFSCTLTYVFALIHDTHIICIQVCAPI